MVTSTQDALTTAGLAAINAASAGDAFTVTAPAPAAVGAEFTPANLETYRAVVFLNTGIASPLTDAQRANFEAYFRKGGGFVGIGSAIETDPSWPFLTNVLGTRASSRTEVQTGHDEGLRPHPRREQVAPAVLGAQRPLVQPRPTNVRGVSHVLATVVEDPFGPQPQGADAGRHRGRHDGRQPPGLLLQGLPGRPLVLHRARQHAPRRSTRR